VLLNNRDSRHEKDYISFILDPVAMKIYRGVCKYTIHVWIKRTIKQSGGLPGTYMPTSNCAAERMQEQQAQLLD